MGGGILLKGIEIKASERLGEHRYWGFRGGLIVRPREICTWTGKDHVQKIHAVSV